MSIAMSSALALFNKVLEIGTEGKYGKLTDSEKLLIESNGSITRLLSPFILTPTIVVTDGVADEIKDKLISLNIDIFTAFYIQAFKVMTEVNSVDANVAFDMLSDNKGMSVAKAINRTNVVNEEFLPFEEHITLENKNKGELVNTVTKEFDITIKIKGDDKRTVVIPMVVKANIIYTTIGSVINVLDGNSGTSFFERYHEYKSGGISLKDFVFSTDLIEKYKNHRLNDKDELMKYMKERTNEAYMNFDMKTGTGYSTNYSMVLVGSNEVPLIDKVLKTSLYKDTGKNKFLSHMKAMSLSVTDDIRKRVAIFTKDVTGVSQTNFKALDKKKNGNDLEDIMKSLLLNKSPII